MQGCLPHAASKEAGCQSPISTHPLTKPTRSLRRRQDRLWPSGARLGQRRTLPGSQLPCNQPCLSLISLHFPHKCSSLTHLDASFPHLRSFSWTSPLSWVHNFFTLSFHQPWGSGWSRRRQVCLTVLQGCKTWALFLLFPTADHIPKEHQGTIWLCFTPKISHKNTGFNERSPTSV